MPDEFHRRLWTGRLAIAAGIGLCILAWCNGLGFHWHDSDSLSTLSGERLIHSASLLLGMAVAVCGAALIDRRAWARWSLEALCWAALFSTIAAGIWIVPAGILQKALWPGSAGDSPRFFLAELASFAWTLALTIPLVALLRVLRSPSLRDSMHGLY